MSHCLFCRRGLKDGVSLFRVNAKGQPGVWACERHIGQTDAKVDPITREITDIIQGRKP
jgi:hypothetical protein